MQIYLILKWNTSRYYHSRSEKMEVIEMKKYLKLPGSPKLGPHHQIHFLLKRGSHPTAEDTVCDWVINVFG